MIIDAIGVFVGFGISLFFVYFRKETWLQSRFQYEIGGTFFIAGIIGFFISEDDSYLLMFYQFLIPFIIILINTFFKWISCQLHHRDYFLHLRGSKEADTVFGENPHLKQSDSIFSALILCFVIGLNLLGFSLVN